MFQTNGVLPQLLIYDKCCIHLLNITMGAMICNISIDRYTSCRIQIFFYLYLFIQMSLS